MLINGQFIIGCLKSVWDIGRYVLSGKIADVVFVAPQHFNRDTNGQNPYFEKLIKCCEEENLSYIKLESPEYGAPQPHDPSAIRIDFLFWLMMLLRKVFIRLQGHDDRRIDRKVGTVINAITFGRLKSRCYITMAGLFIEIFQEIYPNATVYDLQHGIIYAGHPGYFDPEGNLAESLDAPNGKVLVWGEGIRKIFIDSCKNSDISTKVIVTGYPLSQNIQVKENAYKRTILFSLQFTHSLNDHQLQQLKEMLDEALVALDNLDFCIKLKQHPRYYDSISIDDVLRKHPDVELTDLPLNELAKETLLHITWSSTTIFEFASYGVPSYILADERYPNGAQIYYNQFRYPIFRDKSLKDTLTEIESPKIDEIRKTLADWYSSIYSPFKNDVAVSILKGDY